MGYDLEKLCEIGMPIAMVALVNAASRRAPIHYKDIGDIIEGRLRCTIASEHIGSVVGSMMDEILQVEPKAPPLNALCVNKATRLPGDGAHAYIKWHDPSIDYKNLTPSEKREVLLPVYEDIFKFEGWPRLARKVFGISLAKPAPPVVGENDGKARRRGYGGPAESEQHIRLKNHVADNPKLFGAPKGCKQGVVERLLRSLDEIDVWFVAPGEQLAVEVKSRISLDWDIERGIYQCIKYKALLEAENKVEKIASKVRACLVTERRLPVHLTKLADTLGIETRLAKID
ncbi:hypothetical protein [Bradyrhizobium tunisiense]|uniref:hypothetical protein n=1 Tax=Bradyrhizobium tunisiense TaxID=3278709 RepID=UPI0035DD14C9